MSLFHGIELILAEIAQEQNFRIGRQDLGEIGGVIGRSGGMVDQTQLGAAELFPDPPEALRGLPPESVIGRQDEPFLAQVLGGPTPHRLGDDVEIGRLGEGVGAYIGYLSASDLALIPLKNIDLFKGVLPSKLFDAWACARPVLMSVDGEARQILEEINGGIFSPPEDVEQMARAILWMLDHPQEREVMGANGRIYTVQNHSHPQLANKLADILLEVVQNH